MIMRKKSNILLEICTFGEVEYRTESSNCPRPAFTQLGFGDCRKKNGTYRLKSSPVGHSSFFQHSSQLVSIQ